MIIIFSFIKAVVLATLLSAISTNVWGFSEQKTKVPLPTHISIAAPEIRPLVYIDENGNVAGKFVTMFEQFSVRTGVNVDITVMPWGRALQQVKSGTFDALMPTLFTEERSSYLTFPKVPLVVFSGSVILQHRQDTREIASWDDIKKAQIVKVRSMNLGENVEQLFTNHRNSLIEVVRITDGLKMLQHQRVDFVVMDALIASSLIEELRLENTLKVIPHPEEARLINSYLAFSTSFAEQFDVEKIMGLINQYNDPDKYIK
ncbi:transporter substrate-binding domain-containing protein [Thalassotalea sp. 1_MG-2023]|uniref:substrate-binding periplasmic protein n=1 Tax=Thalassotalea sp. 1_MG-2023 TaxID=3062680 RepID=UPI0026E4487B|nr:transporter substrate-binding domain-containing protein [Thalassotalea sp. 1_MG-2023]MDO6428864.1 transporter substrate-binding domain-containing protein [Thalassotalea sp. 1_MG-2023]